MATRDPGRRGRRPDLSVGGDGYLGAFSGASSGAPNIALPGGIGLIHSPAGP